MDRRLNDSACKAEREWQRLCDAYLPIRVKGSIWRYSRIRNRDDLFQGWKLHVSATILSACAVFRLIAPYLKRRNIWFKAPKSLAELREPGAAVPPWLTDCFQPVRQRSAFERTTPLETDYTGYEALTQRGRGGVYKARDVSSVPVKLCVIKEGRRNGETDWLGHDGFFRIKREAQVLRSTRTAAVPRVIRTFRANGCYYVVTERIAGKSLQDA